MSEVIIRKATKNDIPFLAQIILLAETSNKELISYRKMFNLKDEELLNGFELVLNNEQLGHGLTYLTFLIAEVNGERAAAASAYIEGEFGNSNHIMTGALINGFGTELVIEAFRKNSEFKDIQIAKTAGTLQIDSVATLPEYRGKGLLKLIVEQHCKNAISKGCKELEIQVWAGNEVAILSYKKLGCIITNEKYINCENKNAFGRVLMSKKII